MKDFIFNVGDVITLLPFNKVPRGHTCGIGETTWENGRAHGPYKIVAIDKDSYKVIGSNVGIPVVTTTWVSETGHRWYFSSEAIDVTASAPDFEEFKYQFDTEW